MKKIENIDEIYLRGIKNKLGCKLKVDVNKKICVVSLYFFDE